MIIFPILGAGGGVTQFVESSAPAVLELGQPEESGPAASLTIRAYNPRPATSSGDVRGVTAGAALLSVELGQLQELAAAAVSEIGFNASASLPASGEIAAQNPRAALALLDVGGASAEALAGGALSVGGEASRIGAPGALAVTSRNADASGGALRIARQETYSGALAALQVAFRMELDISASVSIGADASNESGAALEVSFGDGFIIAVDILDAILATGRGNLC